MENYKEIGSEFWLENFNEDKNKVYVLSGRTAIDLILQNMMASGRQLNSVYMPAWCCDSMLQPFIDWGVNISFYDVTYINGHLQYRIDPNYKTDILYLTNYFGFANVLTTDIITQYKARDVTILYDQTHSLFIDNDTTSEFADYTFASIRKWMGIPCGAYLCKSGDKIDMQHMRDFPYLREKIDAMRLKADYINESGKIDKQMFLKMYANFGRHLAEDYCNYKMDELSLYLWQNIDKDCLKKKRCANANTLQLSLQEIPHVTPMFIMANGDCPLFVPVLLESKGERDALRRYLSSNAVYCPIHWPKPSFISDSMEVNSLYDCELSLICDQRYGFDEMQRIIDVIKEYYNNI